MDELSFVTAFFNGLWGLAMDLKIGGIPIVYVFLFMTVLGILVKFVKGKK